MSEEDKKPEPSGKCPGCGEPMKGKPHVHQPDGPDARCLKCSGLTDSEYAEAKDLTAFKYMKEGKDHATWPSAKGAWPFIKKEEPCEKKPEAEAPKEAPAESTAPMSTEQSPAPTAPDVPSAPESSAADIVVKPDEQKLPEQSAIAQANAEAAPRYDGFVPLVVDTGGVSTTCRQCGRDSRLLVDGLCTACRMQ